MRYAAEPPPPDLRHLKKKYYYYSLLETIVPPAITFSRLAIAEMTTHSLAAPAHHTVSPQLRQVIGKYELGAALAAGDFDCRTRLCSHVVTGAPYVVRIYDKSVLEEAQWMWERVRASIHVQRTLPKHENIVEMVECFETTSSLYILMQLFQSVNVTKLLCSDIVDDGGVEAGDGAVPPSAFSSHWSDTVNRANQIRSGAMPTARHVRIAQPSMNSSAMALGIGNGDEPSSSGRTGPSEPLPRSASASALPRHFPRRRARLTIQQVCNYFTQVVRGVLHMHEHHVVHLGIAPDHILINDRGLVKIGNLVSCCFCTPGAKMGEMKGTRHTVAPEVLTSDPFDPYLADAWSLGILLYFMLNGRYPHDGANTLEHIMYNHLRPPDAHLPASAKDLLNQLLQPDPTKRMPVSEILQHRFFSEDSAAEEAADSGEPLGSNAKTRNVEEEAASIIQKAYRRYTEQKNEGMQMQKDVAAAAAGPPPSAPPAVSLAPPHGSFHELLLRHVKKHDGEGTSGLACIAGRLGSEAAPRQTRLSQVACPMERADTIMSTQEALLARKSSHDSPHSSPTEKPTADYMPCPVCHRPPQAARNICAKPYATSRYSYVPGGRFILPSTEDIDFHTLDGCTPSLKVETACEQLCLFVWSSRTELEQEPEDWHADGYPFIDRSSAPFRALRREGDERQFPRMRVYPVCFVLFVLLTVADVFLFSVRNAIISNAEPVDSKATLDYIMIVVHSIVLVLELAVVLVCMGCTFWTEGLLIGRMLHLLKFYFPFFVVRLFFVIFNTLYESRVLPSPDQRRPWSTPSYTLLMIADIIFYFVYFLAGMFVLGVLSEKTLYQPFNTSVFPPPRQALRERSRAEDHNSTSENYQRCAMSGNRGASTRLSFSRAAELPPIRRTSTSFPNTSTDAPEHQNTKSALAKKSGFYSSNTPQGPHTAPGSETITGELSSLLKSVPPLDMPRPIANPETVELLSHGPPSVFLSSRGEHQQQETVLTVLHISFFLFNWEQTSCVASLGARCSASAMSQSAVSPLMNGHSDFIGDRYPLDKTVFLVFGYGSLLWKQGFEFTAVYNSFARGFERRFYQGTRDHRGTPEDPGRVVTMLPTPDPTSRVDGKAFQLPTDPAVVRDILRSLDARETGYVRYEIELFDFDRSAAAGKDVALDIYSRPDAPAEMRDASAPPKKVVALLYLATSESEEYLGPAPIHEMAASILRCHGPSGSNKEYLYLLADNLRSMGAHDQHVFDLYEATKQLEAAACRGAKGKEVVSRRSLGLVVGCLWFNILLLLSSFPVYFLVFHSKSKYRCVPSSAFGAFTLLEGTYRANMSQGSRQSSAPLLPSQGAVERTLPTDELLARATYHLLRWQLHSSAPVAPAPARRRCDPVASTTTVTAAAAPGTKKRAGRPMRIPSLWWALPSLAQRVEAMMMRRARQEAWRRQQQQRLAGPRAPTKLAVRLLATVPPLLSRAAGFTAEVDDVTGGSSGLGSSGLGSSGLGSSSAGRRLLDKHTNSASSHLSSSLSAPSNSDSSESGSEAPPRAPSDAPRAGTPPPAVETPPSRNQAADTSEPLAEWDAVERGEEDPHPAYLFHSSVVHQWAHSPAGGRGGGGIAAVGITFSPAGDAFLVGFSDGTLWFVVLPAPPPSEQHPMSPLCASYLGNVAPGGRSIEGTALLGLGLKEERLFGHTGAITGLAFSDSGGEFASCAEDGCLILWNAATRSKLRRIFTSRHSPGGGCPQFVVFAPHNNNYCIVSFREDPDLHLLNTSTGLPVTGTAPRADSHAMRLRITSVAVNAGVAPFAFTGHDKGGVSLWTSFHFTGGGAPAVPLLGAPHGAKPVSHYSINEMRSPQLRRMSTLYIGGLGGMGRDEICRLEVARLTLPQAQRLVYDDRRPSERKAPADSKEAWFSALSSIWATATGAEPSTKTPTRPQQLTGFLCSLCALQLIVSDRTGNVHILGVTCHQRETSSRSRVRNPFIYSLVPLWSCGSPEGPCAGPGPNLGAGATLARDSDRLVTLACATPHSIYIVTPVRASNPSVSHDRTNTFVQRRSRQWVVHSTLRGVVSKSVHFTDVAWSSASRFLVAATSSGALLVWERLYLPHQCPTALTTRVREAEWDELEKWSRALAAQREQLAAIRLNLNIHFSPILGGST
eukprot:gene10177-7129_t